MAAERIAILGGTFDPPHLGHLALATGVADAMGLDKVLLVPTGNPHFKLDKKVTPVEDRVAMVELMAAVDTRLQVSRIEVDREGITYTVDTLKELLAENPGAELLFIVGGDCIGHIWRWRAADELAKLCTVVAVERRGFDYAADQEKLRASGIDFNVEYLSFDVPEVSSTDIRECVAAGESLSALVLPSVADYIRAHELYSA